MINFENDFEETDDGGESLPIDDSPEPDDEDLDEDLDSLYDDLDDIDF